MRCNAPARSLWPPSGARSGDGAGASALARETDSGSLIDHWPLFPRPAVCFGGLMQRVEIVRTLDPRAAFVLGMLGIAGALLVGWTLLRSSARIATAAGRITTVARSRRAWLVAALLVVAAWLALTHRYAYETRTGALVVRTDRWTGRVVAGHFDRVSGKVYHVVDG